MNLIFLIKKIIRRSSLEINKALSSIFEGRVITTRKEIQTKSKTEVQFFSFKESNFGFHGNIPFWCTFKNVPLREIGLTIEKDVKVISGGIILTSMKEVILESTISSLEYLNKQNKNHLIYLNRCIPSMKSLDKIIVLSNYLEKQYYHWNMESLGRLALIDENKLKNYTIIVDSNAPNFVIDSLQVLFGIEKNRILENPYWKISAKEVLLPSFPITRNELTKDVNLYFPEIIKKLNLLSKKRTNIEKNKRNLVISRSKATQRRILNMELIITSFPDMNFEIVELENYTFLEQIQLFRNANVIIAAHGAGLVNVMYGENPFIIEFFPSNRTERDSFYFYQISSSLNFVHHIFEYKAINGTHDLILGKRQLKQIENILVQHDIHI